MNQTFDIFNRAEKPSLTLCNPDKTEIYSLDMAYNVVYVPRFNSMDSLSFTLPESINGTDVEAYDFVKSKRIVLLGDLGYFEIVNPVEDKDGVTNIKNVDCRALEMKSVNKRLIGFNGTYKFYDLISPEGTLLQEMLDRLPTWSVGSVDSSLLNKYRTFSIDETSVYNFLMDEVATAYECIFEFDTINSKIYAYTVDSAVTETDIYLSFDNLIKNGRMIEKNEEITTCLFVYGAGNLDIRTVNPLGTSAIYDFSYYATTDWMTQDLIDAIDDWQIAIDANQTDYADNLTLLKTYSSELVVEQSELVDLQNEYLALEGIQKTRIESNLDYSDINILLVDKQVEIDAKESEISTTEGNISNVTTTLEAINDSLSFDNNFTEAQYTTLSEFIFENTYQNENFVQTDIMENDEIQEIAQELYDQGVSVLGRISQPRYEFKMEGVNFLFLPEFSEFKNQIELGAEITIDFGDGTYTQTNVLEFSIAYDNPQDFDMTLSNRLRLDNEAFTYSDLIGKTIKTGSSVSFGKLGWENWNTIYKDDVSTFIDSALDASVNNVINSTNQEILIDQNGLRGRQFIAEGQYSDNQVWLTSDVLAFTEDNWETASAALGRIEIDGVDQYGLIADVVVGRLLAGNQLTIENEGNHFLLDASGAYLTDATFFLTTSNNKNRISLNADDGILIESNPSGTWETQFHVDSSGNVVFSGDLSGATGTFSGSIIADDGFIGGWDINSNGLFDSHGNYIRSDGNIKLGALSISGSTAIFDGDIYADKLIGQIVNTQVATGLNAGKITDGNMSGNRIYGGRINGSGGKYVDLDGAVMFLASSFVGLSGSTGVDLVGASYVSIRSSGIASIQGGTVRLYPSGNLEINGNIGQTSNLPVGGAYAAVRLHFYKGIFTGYTYI